MNKLLLLGPLVLSLTSSALGQSNASIFEETVSIETYSFDTPNPVPIVADNSKLAPYFKFEGYSQTPQTKQWKVVSLENEYIKLWVLPEIGGKVWGAIEKSTGEEFLYKNEVVKFRNIALRGPWTSGGIEFNFGIIGHQPATASPVDYSTRENADGSVSCFVGNTDLPSNTKWTVEIRLEKDNAFFETKASWYNASPLTESYYNWMTAATVATNDLEMIVPGNQYVGHSGDTHSWPINDQGRNLAMYKNNNFGPAKSYHVVGEYNDFFGGYYHDKKLGYGHWSPYEEMPGQKLFLWASSREGGIWEDLLTDTDGQYVEYQAGRLLNQYGPSGAVNPISQVGFDPYVMDSWSEIWFPFKEIGGMVDASKEAVLNIEHEKESLYVGVNALQKLDQKLQVKINGTVQLAEDLDLEPMGVFSTQIPATPTDVIEVLIVGTEIAYSNGKKANRIKRPFYPDMMLKVSKSEELYQAGLEALEYRQYAFAREKLSELVSLDPSHRSGLLALAELEYRRTDYTAALELANAVLKMDTYNSKANYLAGIIYRAVGDHLNALESLGWAARDVKYRSVAYAQMAEIYLKDKNLGRAKTNAAKALAFNVNSTNAREVLLLAAKGDGDNLEEYAQGVLDIDPLNFIAKQEVNRFNNRDKSDVSALPKIQNEFPEETVLAMAIRYAELGFPAEGLETLLEGKKAVKNDLWAAYLQKDNDPNESRRLLNDAVASKVNLVFPYRRDTIPVLEWATQQDASWKLKFYLSQNYMVVGKKKEALLLLDECADRPDSDIFYRFRAKVTAGTDFEKERKDYLKALALNPSDWKVSEEFIQFYADNGKTKEVLDLSSKAYGKFPKSYNIALAHANASVNSGNYRQAVAVLEKIQVLPFEGARASRKIFEKAYIGAAIEDLNEEKNAEAIKLLNASKQWPENIGVGRPYDVDERPQDYLIGLAHQRIGEVEKSKAVFEAVRSYSLENIEEDSINHLYGLLAAKNLSDDALKDLMDQLKKAKPGSQSELAVATFDDETKLNDTARRKSNISDSAYEMMKWSLQEANH